MTEDPRYMIAQHRELPKPGEFSHSVPGRIGRNFVWIRRSERQPRHLASRAWMRFFEDGFESCGVVHETFAFAPFWGESHSFFRQPATGIIGSLTRHVATSSAAFYVVFDDGLILWMNTRARVGGPAAGEMTDGWIRYVASDDPDEAYAYLLKAIDHFTSQGRSVVDVQPNHLVELRSEYFRRRPQPWDTIKLFGVLYPLLLGLFLGLW